MNVILQESYMNLGEAGDVVNVKSGYARNYLIPQKLAVTATPANLKRLQDKVKVMETKKLAERERSQKTLEQLEEIKLTLKKKVSDDGKLYGAVTAKDIEEELQALGCQVDRRMIVLGQQVKMAGDYSVLIKLVGGLKANIPLSVISDAPPKEVEEDVVYETDESDDDRYNENYDDEDDDGDVYSSDHKNYSN